MCGVYPKEIVTKLINNEKEINNADLAVTQPTLRDNIINCIGNNLFE